MALASTVCWEVRPTTGNNANGGGFDTLRTGTDYSQQSSPQVTFDGVTIRGTTSAANGTLTVVGYTVSAADAGNIVNITGGTNFIAGRYSVNSVTVGTNVWNLDRACTSAAGAAMTGRMGGAVLSITTATGATAATGNKYFVKAESGITITASIAFSPTAVTPSSTNMPNRLIGYNATRGDGGRVTITCSTNTGITALSSANAGAWIENFDINCASLGTSTGVSVTGSSQVRNCKVSNATSNGITLAAGSNSCVYDCEVTGCTAAATAAVNSGTGSNQCSVLRCWVHDNACPGILNGAGGHMVAYCLVTNNTGASSDGIRVVDGSTVVNNTCYNNGRHGIMKNATTFRADLWYNNLLVSNGGYGISGNTASGQPATEMYDGNAFFGNTSGTRQNMDAAGSTTVNGTGTYTNVKDVVLTGTPFVNAAAGDFRLNAGAGALCRGTGLPGALPGVTQTGRIDFGCLQHADPPRAPRTRTIKTAAR